MIIGATKKAQPLFSALPIMEDKEYGRQFAQANPLFSWHANYINVNRKKVLILLNDLTYTIIILQDINAQKKKQLAELIPEAIRAAFEIAGISNEKTAEYLKVSGGIQVTNTSNRSVLGSVNLVAEELSTFRLNIHQTINRDVMVYYSDYIHMRLSKQGYRNSAEALQAALGGTLLKWEEPVEAEAYIIEKKWDYRALSQVNVSELSEQQEEEYQSALLKNNQELLRAFKAYLTTGKGLGEKTVKRHIDQLDFYLNGYLAGYMYATPLKMEESPLDYLGYFYPHKYLMSAVTSLKKNASALKKFYQFLYEAGEITQDQRSDANEFIEAGLQMGEAYLLSTSDDEFWY